ncbi:MAG: hypothetical protein V8S72_07940 [Oscillospiraceae bacterium]
MTVIKKLTAALLCLCTLLLCACAGEEQRPGRAASAQALVRRVRADGEENLMRLIEEFNASSSGYRVVRARSRANEVCRRVRQRASSPAAVRS